MWKQTSKVKSYMYQLLKAVAHMHKNGIFHRDIKPEVRHFTFSNSFICLQIATIHC